MERSRFEPRQASQEEWARLHEYRRQAELERRPDDPVTPDRIFEEQTTRPNPFEDRRYWYATDSGKVVSHLTCSVPTPANPSYESQKHLLFADAHVLAPFRRRGIGSGWLEQVSEMMHEQNRTLLTFGTEHDDGRSFAAKIGAEERFTGAENRLDLTKVDWEMVERWVDEAAGKAPDSKLELYEHRLPDELLDEFARVVTDLADDVPMEGLDVGRFIMTPELLQEYYARGDIEGSSHYVILVREPDGEISAMTDVIYRPAAPNRISQLLTGVRPAHRGKGLGKLVKARMLLHLRETYPAARWIATENANSNAPMLAINTKLGFKTYRGESSYQISREALDLFLAGDRSG